MVFLPLYTFSYLFPSFDKLLTEKTEDEAVRVANHCAAGLMNEAKPLDRTSITTLVTEEIENVSRQMQLVKVKVFSPSGEIIYSTDRNDIGEINKNKYFNEIVAKGHNHTKVVRKSSQSLEGQTMPRDVVETYVPLMNNNMFMGAFEIYYDITKSKEDLGRLISWSAVIVVVVTLGLLVGVVISGLNVHRSIRACYLAEEELRKHQEDLEKTLEERSRQIENQIVEKKKVETSLQDTEAKYRSLVESTEDSIYLVDRECRYLFMNRQHMIRMGLIPSQIQGMPYRAYHTQEETAWFEENVKRILETGESFQNEHQSKRDGRYFLQTLSPAKDEQGNIVAITIISKDINERKRMEEELRTLSLTDELTGLYNRRGFLTLAEQYLKIANRMKNKISILYADMDDLKIINDTLGHEKGDRALIETAEILKETFRESDVAARIGGDEFVIMPAAVSGASIDKVLERLRNNISQVNAEAGRDYQISLSCGIALYDPEQPCTIEELLRRGDRMMYESKKGKHSRA